MDKFDEPFHWKKPRSVFVCSVSDLFHEKIDISIIENLLNIIAWNQQHLWFILTKRPKRMVDIILSNYQKDEFIETFSNTWFGVTAENQTRLNERLPLLLQLPSKNLYISAEPLLGPLEIGPLKMIKWLICGGESGLGCRPMDLYWARDLRDQCAKAGVAYYLKQLGGFPDPKHRNKALLDGKLYKELPVPVVQCGSIQKESLTCIHCHHARLHFRTVGCNCGIARCSFLPFSECKPVVRNV